MTDQPRPIDAGGAEPGSPAPDGPEPGAPIGVGGPAAHEPAAAIPDHRIDRVGAPEGGTFGAATQAVLPARRRSGVRWAIALLGVALIVGASAVIVSLAGARPSPSVGLGYMPAGTVSYMELRLDLPGDQAPKLAAFLAAFPGFADQTQIEPKLDDVFDRIVRAASDGAQGWSEDIKPWFGGQIAFGTGPGDGLAPVDVPFDPDGMMPPIGDFLATISVSDRALATTWITDLLGTGAVSSTHAGTDVWTLGDGSGAFAFSVTDTVILLGTDDGVRAALDTGGRGPMAEDPTFAAAFATVERDYLAFTFQATREYLRTAIASIPGAGAELGATRIDDLVLELVPAWQAVVVRLEDDAVVVETASPSIPVGHAAANRRSTIAEHLPPGTLLAAEWRDVGPVLDALVERFRSEPELEDPFAEFDQAMGLLGGFDAAVGWLGDVALVVSADAAGEVNGGIVVVPTAPGDADRFLATIRSYLGLGGASLGLEVRDESYAGTTITIIDASDAIVGQGDAVPPIFGTELAYAATDEIVVFGSGPSFVRAVLDAGPGPSLADDARYRGFVDRVGAENIALSWLDLAAIRELVEPLFEEYAPEDWAAYEADIRAYLAPFDAAVGSNRHDGDLDRGSSIITVR